MENKTCYLTGVALDSSNKSEEHIIPNAIWWKLKSKDVLCAEANLRLSQIIDTPFLKSFEWIYRRCELKRNRPTDTGLTGFKIDNNGNKIDVIRKDNQTFPTKPFFDQGTNTLYARDNKTGEGFLKHLISKGLISPIEKPTISTNIYWEFFIKREFNNDIFRLWFAKIAAWVATLQGVVRENLKSIIDLEKNVFNEKILLIPFYPVTGRDEHFELLMQTKTFPLHAVVLHGDKESKLLYCYIELFSTFKHIIIVDDNYNGDDLHHEYIFELLKSQPITFQELMWRSSKTSKYLNYHKVEYRSYSLDELKSIANISKTNIESLQLYTHSQFLELERVLNELEILNVIRWKS